MQGVLPYNDGSVNVRTTGRDDWTIICSLSNTYTNTLTVGPNVCATWTALLLRAKKNNQQVEFWYSGSGSCAGIATYGSAPVPVYIGEIN